MNRYRTFIAAVILCCVTLIPAAGVTFKIASIAPEQSPWGQALNKLAADWARISGGRVILKIYHNGIAGDERSMISKVRIGQLQGMVLTATGLCEINPDFFSICLPALVRTDRELSYVLEKMRPHYESMLRNTGFVPIAWSKAGWVKFFSKRPVMYPSDLKAMKLSVGGQNDMFVQVWKVMGYQAVPVAIPQVLSALNSGMIEAVYSSPLAVGGYQWFGITKHMLDFNVSPFIGSILLSERSWRQVPADLRPKLMEAVREVEVKLDSDTVALENAAVETMRKHGLVIHQVSEDARTQWFKEFGEAYKHLIGSVITQEAYDTINGYVQEIRK